MLGKTYDGEVCSAARALELVGERWSLLIVRKAMFGGARRYGDFRSLGIATNVLQNRLDAFVENGLMERVEKGRHAEYVLTEMGHDLKHVLVALTAWGDRWAAPAGPPILFTHTSCGAPVSMESRCEGCGPVPSNEVGAVPGPGLPADLAAGLRALDDV